jgi:DNA-binding response OmpR family regulator
MAAAVPKLHDAIAAWSGEKSPRVLCIDDEPDISRIIKIRLEQYGVDVRRAFNGMQGYWLAIDMRPDVIVTDMVMPDGEGTYVMGRLKSHPLTQEIPVIVLSGQDNPALKRQMLSLGASAYLIKPLVVDELIRELRTHIVLPETPGRISHVATLMEQSLDAL